MNKYSRKVFIWAFALVLLVLFLKIMYSIDNNFQPNADGFVTDRQGSETSSSNHVGIFTQFYTDDFFKGVLTLAHSVHKHHPNVEFNIMYIEGRVSQVYLDAFTTLGYTLRRVNLIRPAKKPDNPRHNEQFTKLRLWTFTEYDRVIYLDGDCLVVGDLSPLFSISSEFPFAAVGDVWDRPDGFDINFNAGMLSLTPSITTYNHLVETISKTDKYNPAMAEQAMLNYAFKYSHLKLPYVFGLNLAMHQSHLHSVWKGLYPAARVIHYTAFKPFRNPEKRNEFPEPFSVWLEEYNEAMAQLRAAGVVPFTVQ